MGKLLGGVASSLSSELSSHEYLRFGGFFCIFFAIGNERISGLLLFLLLIDFGAFFFFCDFFRIGGRSSLLLCSSLSVSSLLLAHESLRFAIGCSFFLGFGSERALGGPIFLTGAARLISASSSSVSTSLLLAQESLRRRAAGRWFLFGFGRERMALGIPNFCTGAARLICVPIFLLGSFDFRRFGSERAVTGFFRDGAERAGFFRDGAGAARTLDVEYEAPSPD